MGYFCRNYVMFELKKYRVVVLQKMTYGFKNYLINLVKVLKVVVESKVGKSSAYNVLAEGMCFLGQSSPSNFNFLDFPLLV